MTREWRVAHETLAAIADDAWQDVPDPGVNSPSRWAPLIPLGPQGKYLGVTADGNWAVGTKDRTRQLQEGWHVPLLPVLESSYEDWVRSVSELRAVMPAIADAIENAVQIGPLLAAAIAGEGEYWPALAMGWLESSPGLPIPSEVLLRFADSGKSKPQVLRRRARALLVRSDPTDRR